MKNTLKILNILIFIFFLSCSDYTSSNTSSSSSSSSSYNPGIGWTLQWSDEFDGPTLNAATWSYDIGYGDIPPDIWGWGLGHLSCFTNSSENSYIENGILVFKAIYTGGILTNRNYTSARINTKGKVSFKYGKIAARMKMPYGKGLQPAFWMFGTNHIYGENWPECGEIDIMEMMGGGEDQDDTVVGTAHFSNDNTHSFQYITETYEIPDPDILADDYRVYAIEWDSNNIVWKLDGVTYHTLPIDIGTYPERSELHNEMFLLLNLAIGSWYDPPGYPDTNTIFPLYMYIDWVRVYTN